MVPAVAALALFLSGCGGPPDARSPQASAEDAAPETGAPPAPSPSPTPAPAPPQPRRQIYLADGGAGLLVLEEWSTGTEVADGWWVLSEPGVQWTAEMETTGSTRQLRIQVFKYHPPMSDWYGELLLFRPSGTRAGDWDLVYGRGAGKEKPGDRIPVPDPLPPGRPLAGFLHRLDEERAVEYFRLAESVDRVPDLAPAPESVPVSTSLAGTMAAEELLRLAREIRKAHPEDLHARYLLLDALLRNERLGELAAELLLFETQAARSGDRLLIARGKRLRRQLKARHLAESGLNGRLAVERYLTATTRPEERLRMAPALLRFEDAISTVPTVIYPGTWRARRGPMQTEQVVTKVNRVYADFCMLTGQRDTARTLLVGMYRAAQLYGMDHDQGDISQLIAIAMRQITVSGLQTLAANACLTAAEAQALWQDLELLNLHEKEFESDSELLPLSETGDQEFRVRHSVSAARFQLVRMTLAVRWHQMATGQLPLSASQIAPLFPAGIPLDPFTSAPLRVEAGQEGVNLYSLGPDRTDQFAGVDYDPTNGTLSAGDIVVRVPVGREYPFPAEGTRAWSFEDVARQYPKGLPPDPFADTKGRGYTVSRKPGPVVVYSFGPDTDESKALKGEPMFERGTLSTGDYLPTVTYDPTNGAVSGGDIFVTLPGGP